MVIDNIVVSLFIELLVLGGYLPVASSYKSQKRFFVQQKQVHGVRDGTLQNHAWFGKTCGYHSRGGDVGIL